jgi:hypothetical protein
VHVVGRGGRFANMRPVKKCPIIDDTKFLDRVPSTQRVYSRGGDTATVATCRRDVEGVWERVSGNAVSGVISS